MRPRQLDVDPTELGHLACCNSIGLHEQDRPRDARHRTHSCVPHLPYIDPSQEDRTRAADRQLRHISNDPPSGREGEATAFHIEAPVVRCPGAMGSRDSSVVGADWTPRRRNHRRILWDRARPRRDCCGGRPSGRPDSAQSILASVVGGLSRNFRACGSTRSPMFRRCCRNWGPRSQHAGFAVRFW